MPHDDDPIEGSEYESASADELQPKKTPDEERKEELRQECLDRFEMVNSTESDQRERELDDLTFDAISQWEDDVKALRKGSTDADGTVIPDRPTLEINLIDQSLQQIAGEARQARLSVKYKPRGASKRKAADRLQGIARAIQAETGAQSGRMWALERAMRCGRGVYKIDTDWADSNAGVNAGAFDLKVVYRRILDQSTVYWDPFSQEADRSDAEWLIDSTFFSKAQHQRRWPHAELPTPDHDLFAGLQRGENPWITNEHGELKFRVAQYYKVEIETEEIAYDPEKGRVVRISELAGEVDELKAAGLRTRQLEKRRVKRYWIDGIQVLQEDDWPGEHIPYIPIDGKEYNVNGERIWKGVIANAKDAQRHFNVLVSAETEALALVPKSQVIMAEGQDEGWEEMWQTANTTAYSVLFYKPTTFKETGQPVPGPQRVQAEPPIQALMMVSQQAIENIKAVTHRFDPSLGQINSRTQSGKAIEALQAQGVASTSSYLDNLAMISMPREGEILRDLVPKVYDRPGRIVYALGEEEDEEEAVIIKTPFYRDEDGDPIPVPCPTCQGRGVAPTSTLMIGANGVVVEQPGPEGVCPTCNGTKAATRENADHVRTDWEYVDLGDATESEVAISVGRSAQTRHEEGMTALGELARAAPDLVSQFADVWVRNMDFPGAEDVADRLKASNPYAQKVNGEPKLPAEAKAWVQQLQMQLQQLQQQYQEAQRAIETDQVKAAAQLKIKQLDGQIRMAVAQVETQARTNLAQLEAHQRERQEMVKARAKALETAASLKGDENMAEVKARLELALQDDAQRHEILMSKLEAAQDAALEAMKLAAQRQMAQVNAELARISAPPNGRPNAT